MNIETPNTTNLMQDQFGSQESFPQSAGFWNNIPRITIDNNWSDMSSTYDWCSGSGTWTDPYLIENVVINAQNDSYCLFINNSKSDFFTIKNCTFFNASTNSAGIYLKNTDDGRFINVNCSLNNGIGILFYNSNNNSVFYNNITHNDFGLMIQENSDDNIVFRNIISDNIATGLNISTASCDSNTVYNNSFIDNGLNANDDGNSNNWDNGSLGNYWHDYTGSDLNDDNIGDSPYNIPGLASSQDLYPLWFDGESIPPELYVNLPTGGTYWSTAPLLNVVAMGEDVDSIWYNVSGNPSKEFLLNETVEYLNDSLWAGLGEGEFQISFFANDTNGNINDSITLTLYKDTITPLLSIISPLDNTYWNIAPNVQVMIFDSNFDSLWYEISGTKIFLSNNTAQQLDNTIWNSLSDEIPFTIYFYGNDSAGNINNTYSYTLYKDVVDPVLAVDLPANHTYWNNAPDIQVTATDTYLDSIWYEVSTSKVFLMSGVSQALDPSIWNALVEGQFTIYFYANDSAGNMNDIYSLVLYKDTVDPALAVDLPGNNTYWTSIPDIQVTSTDTYLDSIWYELSGTEVFLSSGVSQALDMSIWNSLPDEGSFTIYFYANDSAGNVNDIYSLVLYKDIVDPALAVDLPANYSYWNSIPDIQVTSTDTYLDSIWYEVSGTKVFLSSGVSQALDTSIWTGLPDEGSFTIYFYANDSAGNVNDTFSLILYKDIMNPALIVDLPSNYTYWSSIPNIQVTVTDAYIDSIWYEVSGTKISLSSGVSQPLDSGIWDSLPDDSSFTIYFYANDTIGNLNDTISLLLYKDVNTPVLTIDLPSNHTYWNSIPDVQVTVMDSNLDSIWYEVSGTKIFLTNTTPQPLDSGIWDSLPDESSFTIYFYANDTSGDTTDALSLLLYKDVINPSLTVNLPSNHTYWNSVPDVQATVTDTNLDSIWYEVSGTKIILTSGVSQALDSEIWNSLSDESSFTIYFYANDTAGNINDTYSLILYKDVINPSLTIDLPSNHTYWNSVPDVQVTATDTNLDSIWYEVSGTKIFLTSGVSQALDSGIWNSLSDDGPFTIYFYANDTAGNINDTYSLLLYKDVINPSLTIDLPSNHTYWNSAPDIQVTTTDTNLDSIWYEVSGTKIFLTSGVSQALDSSIWDALAEESSFTIYFYANDSAGNLNDTFTLTIYKDILVPSLISYMPVNNTYWNAIPDIRVNFTDNNLDSIWYEVSGTKVFLNNGESQPLNSSIWDSLPEEGVFLIYIFANDSAGNVNNSFHIQLYKDIIAPSLEIIIPINSTSYNSIPNIHVNATDSYLDSVWYDVEGTQIFLTNDVEAALASSIWDSIPDESAFNIYFYTNDSAGNLNNTFMLTLYKDLTTPRLDIILPLNNTYINSIPDIHLNATDVFLDSVWYLVSGSTVILVNDVSQPMDSALWDNLPEEGFFTIYFFANDTAGNINNTFSVTLYKDVLAPRIQIHQPTNSTYYDIPPTLDITVIDPNFEDLYYILSSTYVQLTNNTEQLLNETLWNALPQGRFYVYIYANDTLGNLNDLYFLELFKDTMAPTLVINAPAYNNTYIDTPPAINVTVYDPNWNSLYYTVEGTQVWLENNTEVILNAAIWDDLPQGEFTIYFSAWDSFGLLNDTYSITLFKDTFAPQLEILAPINGTHHSNPPMIQVRVFDQTLHSLWYQIGSDVVALTNNSLEQLNGTLWNTLSEGSFQILFFANDTLGKLNNSFVLTLIKDTIIPEVSVNLPINATYHDSPPILNVQVYDLHLDSLYYIVNGFEVLLTNDTDQSLETTIWDSLASEEEFVIYIFANDSAGNLNNTFSFTLYKDVLAPRIDIIFPQNNDLFGTTAPSYRISIEELFLNEVWYSLDNGVTNYTIMEMIDYINQTEWDKYGNGTVTITFYSNDMMGKMSFEQVTVRKDISAPTITIVTPLTNATYGVNSPSFEIYKDGIGIDDTWYTLDDGATNYMFIGTLGTINQDAWDSFGDVLITIRFYINDSVNNIGTDSVTVLKDGSMPVVVIHSPSNLTYYHLPPSIRIEVFEPHFEDLWYQVGATTRYISNNTEVLLDDSIWYSLGQGEFYLYIFASDSLGNLNDLYSLTLYKDTIAPQLDINSPANNSIWNTPPAINITAHDPNLSSLYYMVGTTQVWLTNNTEQALDTAIWNSLPQGEFELRLYAWDSFGQLNDSLILTLYKDTIAPQLVVESPADDFYTNSPFDINVTAIDLSLDALWYEIGGEIIPLTSGVSQLIDMDIWDSLPEGSFTLEIFANDTFGYLNDSIILSLYKDTIIPEVDIFLPSNNTSYASPMSIRVIMTDMYPDKIWYIVGGTQVFVENGVFATLETAIWDSLPEGQFQIFFYGNDSAGNLNNTQSMILYKDTQAPQVSFQIPLNGTYWNEAAPIHVIALDPNMGHYAIYISVEGTTQIVENDTLTSIRLNIWSLLPEGWFTVRIIARDNFNHVNDTVEISLYKDTVDPSITIINPQQNALYGKLAPDFELSITEPNLEDVWYSLIGNTTIYTLLGYSGTIDQDAWDFFGNGTVTIRFYANDTAGNEIYEDVLVRKNILAPIITVTEPAPYNLYGVQSPLITIYKDGVELASTWYTLDDGVTNFTFTGLTTQIDQSAWDQCNNGTILIRFYINDSVGNIGYDEIILRKDIILPTIIINLPYNHTKWNSEPLINVTSEDPNIVSVWYQVGLFSEYLYFNETSFLDSTLWASLAQGTFVISLFANDSVGNVNSGYTLVLEKDTLGPNITINSPAYHENVGAEAPFFDLIITDPNFHSSWYVIESMQRVYFVGTYGKLNQTMWDNIWLNLTHGDIITITFYARDTLGNYNSETVEVLKFIQEPFNLFEILSGPTGFILTSVAVGVMIPVTVGLTNSRQYKSMDKKERNKLKKFLALVFFVLGLLVLFYLI